jgi:hypothetical protein
MILMFLSRAQGIGRLSRRFFQFGGGDKPEIYQGTDHFKSLITDQQLPFSAAHVADGDTDEDHYQDEPDEQPVSYGESEHF